MFLRFRRDTPSSRGQALVETALILPILALILVMAVDFGRVFFGWVALQNAARVGADYAAQWSCTWAGTCPEDQDKQDRYVTLLAAEMRAINCDLGGTPPDPQFVDSTVDSPPPPEPDGIYDDGDYAVVELECSFDLITPIAESIFGGAVALSAHEEFPIHRQIIQGVPEPPVLPGCDPGEAEVPDMVTGSMTLAEARDLWVSRGFSYGGTPSKFLPLVVSTGPPAGRNANKITISQIPDNHNECRPTATETVVIGLAP